jgi:hypothetical protein
MRHAIGSVTPIFNLYFSGMQDLVRELCDARRVEGSRVKELLRVGHSPLRLGLGQCPFLAR